MNKWCEVYFFWKVEVKFSTEIVDPVVSKVSAVSHLHPVTFEEGE